MAAAPLSYYALLVLLVLPSSLATAGFPARALLQTCNPSGTIRGKSGTCNPENGSECCVDGQRYQTFACSSRVTGRTRAVLTLNSFADGGDGGGRSECDEKFHADSEPVVALSTGWYDGGGRCGKRVVIRAASGKTTTAKVVDECDSTRGCDDEHNFEPPCANNVVDGSPAVWKALGLDTDDGVVPITWSDA
ncbi:ripening-related protein 3 [Brachypodium distachyon]|uniref:Uncharacterized protein n=1 Tax=Brachypodium distachyon TaxID=15368 RepID=I1I4Y8_BRADI|nr:ripening-related protein 3 [Brachypodium distachyon]KQJ97232.1 hypothetical protein BRADI_3g29580v3 [Brachypodium distachyon]|eukprot:XP_003571925.1 ripening-related protein 3 [Brachypodium distachyon]